MFKEKSDKTMENKDSEAVKVPFSQLLVIDFMEHFTSKLYHLICFLSIQGLFLL